MQIAEQFSSKVGQYNLQNNKIQQLLNEPLQIYENQENIITQSCEILDSLWKLKPQQKQEQEQEQQEEEQQDYDNDEIDGEEQQCYQDDDNIEQESNEENSFQNGDKEEKENLTKFLEMAENEDLEQIDLEDADDSDTNNNDGKTAKYKDFFLPDNDNENSNDNNSIEHQEDDIFDQMREQDLLTDHPTDSRQTQIQKLEQKLLAEKSWQLKGEITAQHRPVDSLVSETLDFKSGIRLQEEITKEGNDLLEGVIKQRILDELWDDNEVVVEEGNIQENFNKFEEINFEKPKGLAETYEDEYKQSVLQLPSAKPEDKTKSEIQQLFQQLTYKLDLLSNLKFTPKPLLSKPAEIIHNNVPTILREEKIPIFVSQKSVMTQKELFQVNKDAKFFEKEELTPEEKLKLRQKMKKNFKSRQRHSLLKKKISKLNASKKFAYNLIQKNKKQQKIMEGMKKEKSVKFTKSAEFFKNLQENQDTKKSAKKKK